MKYRLDRNRKQNDNDSMENCKKEEFLLTIIGCFNTIPKVNMNTNRRAKEENNLPNEKNENPQNRLNGKVQFFFFFP